jgi:hypothetical protein
MLTSDAGEAHRVDFCLSFRHARVPNDKLKLDTRGGHGCALQPIGWGERATLHPLVNVSGRRLRDHKNTPKLVSCFTPRVGTS